VQAAPAGSSFLAFPPPSWGCRSGASPG
jgi:hypothetical protein